MVGSRLAPLKLWETLRELRNMTVCEFMDGSNVLYFQNLRSLETITQKPTLYLESFL